MNPHVSVEFHPTLPLLEASLSQSPTITQVHHICKPISVQVKHLDSGLAIDRNAITVSFVVLCILVEFVAVSGDRSQFALWVSFYEIYNESVYDLLQASLTSKTQRRTALRVCEDSAGNSYVRGVCVGRQWDDVPIETKCPQVPFCFMLCSCSIEMDLILFFPFQI